MIGVGRRVWRAAGAPIVLLNVLRVGTATADGAGPHLADLRGLTRSALAERLRGTSPEDLIALGREGARALGTYRARLVKQERVGGKLLPAQTIEVTIRPSPPTLRLEYVAGPKAGRRVLWSEKDRPSEMRVREGGILGIASLWIDIDGRLAHADSNHRVTELGFGPLLDLVESDLRKGKLQGGHTRRDQGFDAKGIYCMEFIAPPGAKGLYAERTRFCVDASLGLPVRIEVFDRHGFLERYDYTDIRPHQKVEASTFGDI